MVHALRVILGGVVGHRGIVRGAMAAEAGIQDVASTSVRSSEVQVAIERVTIVPRSDGEAVIVLFSARDAPGHMDRRGLATVGIMRISTFLSELIGYVCQSAPRPSQ